MLTKRTFKHRPPAGKTEGGMTLIELMLAITMLVVGMLGIMILVTTAITSNNRNKLDTTGTLLAQLVLEKIASLPATATGSIPLTDCNPSGANNFTINLAGAASPGAGANLTSTGSVDFTQAFSGVASGYKMGYVVCGANGQQSTYDVRWNIQTISAWTKMVTVSARQSGATSAAATSTQLRYFAPPVTLRTIVGN